MHKRPWHIWPGATDGTVIATVPWRAGDTFAGEKFEVLGISEWIRLDDDDLALIVRAVNAYAGLVEAVTQERNYLASAEIIGDSLDDPRNTLTRERISRLNAILKAAEG